MPVERRTFGGTECLVASPPQQAEAVLVCLHGRNDDASFAFDEIGVHRFVRGAELPWTVVGLDGGATSYWHRRSDGRDPLATVFDVHEALDAELPLLLLGWSMGGYGALLAAAQRPTDVRAVAASAPAMWRSLDASADGAFDDEADFGRNDVLGSPPTVPTLVVCGEDDPFAAVVRTLERRLPNGDVDVRPGFHEAATWRSFVPDQLAFLQRHVTPDADQQA